LVVFQHPVKISALGSPGRAVPFASDPQNTRIAVDTSGLPRRTKHGEGSGASEEDSGKETVVEGRRSALEERARKEPTAKIAKTLKRTEGATRQKAKSERISLSMTRKKRVPAKKR
jgi:hypothetical protein